MLKRVRATSFPSMALIIIIIINKNLYHAVSMKIFNCTLHKKWLNMENKTFICNAKIPN